MKTLSIRSRLINLLSISLIIVALASFCSIFIFLNYKVNKHFDNALMAEASNIINRLYVQRGQIQFIAPELSINLQTASGKGSVFYSIENEHKTVISGFESIPRPHFNKRMDNVVFYDAEYATEPIRALLMVHKMERNGVGYYATIIIAETLEDRHDMIQEIFLVISGVTCILIFIVVIVSLIAVNKGIEPLVNLQYFIKKRDINDLTPISEKNVPKEVLSLVESINQLFIKLKKSFSHIEHFNADVSHQLRTPLAELKVLIEMDEELKKGGHKNKYIKIIDTMSHTTQQLLMYAKTNPDAFDRVRFEPMNLTELCQRVASDKVLFFYQEGFEFEFDAIDATWINGGPIILESLINNLLDNALHYARTPEGKAIGVVILRVKKEDKRIILSVIDEGPGIEECYFDKVYERFFRLDTKTYGSGLGLGIVKQIALLHNATLFLSNGTPQGLRIDVSFPSLA
ncbi:MAG: sensor histidine kinase N-terminal domain-containing protein [Sulfurospirillaceae bacterium]|nr:sensor histidine kinase N-terminal domain-containing protein [Sulfurospirillaceae bacterium]MDD2826494.1 sensor histidine kinase N-terminal domain-containing protein [Sulfurospirillaceae bacterium]